jgi:hypothetical protein
LDQEWISRISNSAENVFRTISFPQIFGQNIFKIKHVNMYINIYTTMVDILGFQA